jgi:hypothetical protein
MRLRAYDLLDVERRATLLDPLTEHDETNTQADDADAESDLEKCVEHELEWVVERPDREVTQNPDQRPTQREGDEAAEHSDEQAAGNDGAPVVTGGVDHRPLIVVEVRDEAVVPGIPADVAQSRPKRHEAPFKGRRWAHCDKC